MQRARSFAESAEPDRPSSAGWLPHRPRHLAATRVQVDRRGPFGTEVRLDPRHQRVAGDRCDDAAVGPIPEVWLPPDPHLARPRRLCDEYEPSSTDLVRGEAAAACRTAPEVHLKLVSHAAATKGCQPRLGVRLRVRSLRQRPADQVPVACR